MPARQTTEIVVNNPLRTRKWGWDFEFLPAPAPARPHVVNTIRQVLAARRRDGVFRARNGAYVHDVLFYDGKRVVRVDSEDTQHFLNTFEHRWDDEMARLYFDGPMTLTVEV